MSENTRSLISDDRGNAFAPSVVTPVDIESDSARYIHIEDEIEEDEETINWVQLTVRIFAIILLLGIFIFVAVGYVTSPKLLVFSAVIAALLILTIFCTFKYHDVGQTCSTRYRDVFRGKANVVNNSSGQPQ
jgi:hypothetical protein